MRRKHATVERVRVLVLSILALGCTQPDVERGRLICQKEGKTFEAYVPRGARAAVTARAEEARLTDCRFEAGPPTIEHWPVIAEPIPRIPRIPRPPTTTTPLNVAPAMLDNNRIGGGSKTILPDDETRAEIRGSGKSKVIGSYKLCISVDGEVATVSQLKSTGFSAYDGKIIRELEGWRYLPYIYNGDPVPVCTAVTILYTVD